MDTLDATNERLIELIAQDPLLSSASLARQLNVSAATVRRRRKRMIENGLVRLIFMPDPYKTGFPIASVIAFNLDHNHLDAALEALSAKHEVRWLAATTGRFDALAIAYFASTDALHEFIVGSLRDVPGIKESETFVCLTVRKRGTALRISPYPRPPLGPWERHVIPPP